jgi:hypothetical protein
MRKLLCYWRVPRPQLLLEDVESLDSVLGVGASRKSTWPLYTVYEHRAFSPVSHLTFFVFSLLDREAGLHQEHHVVCTAVSGEQELISLALNSGSTANV